MSSKHDYTKREHIKEDGRRLIFYDFKCAEICSDVKEHLPDTPAANNTAVTDIEEPSSDV